MICGDQPIMSEAEFMDIRAFLKNNLDKYTLALIGTVVLATVCPVYGRGYDLTQALSKIVVGLLFFLHGAKLSRQNLWLGLTHWRLHLLIMGATFVMFPLMGLMLGPVLKPMLNPDLYAGLLFICVLPSTVQSSIAFTSIARGNVAAAICAASFSSLLGIILSPLLSGLVLGSGYGGISAQAVTDLCLQLLLPFTLGQLLRGRLISFLDRRKSLIGYVDRLSILFIVYVSFSHGTNTGLWHSLNLGLFLRLVMACGILLVLALLLTHLAGRLFGFNRPDRIAILFCGSKKSLVSGVPMANVIFPAALASTIILPLMVFHQMQLMACAWIARRLSLSD